MTETDYSDYEETEADIIDSIGSAIDDEFLTDEALPNSVQPVQINTVTDKDIWTVSVRKCIGLFKEGIFITDQATGHGPVTDQS